MKHKILSFLLTMLMSMAASVASAYDAKIDGIYYNFDSSKNTATVTYEYFSLSTRWKSDYSGNVIIPESVTYNDVTYSVTSIGSSAFSGCTGLTSITIPNSVTSIGGYAFGECYGLKELVIADGKRTLSLGYNPTNTGGQGLFSNCPLETVYLGRNLSYETDKEYGYSPFYGKEKLTSVTIGESVTSIGSHAFRNCEGLTSVTIGESVTSIGSYAFYSCTGLTSVTIPNSVTSIGGYAFDICEGLTSVTIPNSVTSIGNFAFDGIKELVIEDGEEGLSCGTSGSNSLFFYCPLETLYLGRQCINCPFRKCSSLTSVTIGESVTSIGNETFSGCTGLTSVTIPNSVTSIGASAFSGCTGLTSITIPESVTSVGEDAFKGCTELTAVHTSNLAAWFGISFANVSSNPLSNAHHLYVDGEEVTEVSIPESITTIGAHTFYGCSEITSVTGGRNLTNIGKSAFYGCEKLKYFYVPGGVKNIEASTFEGCKRMTEVRIGSGVETIGNRAFYDCPLLRIYNYAEFPQNCGTNTFSVVKSNCKLFVHADSQDLYSVHQDWYEFNIQPMDDEALAIENVNVNENDNETLRYEKGVYDLSGRKVNVNDSKLKKGIYIVNGKKTQVR